MLPSQWMWLEPISLSNSRYLSENAEAVCRKSCLSAFPSYLICTKANGERWLNSSGQRYGLVAPQHCLDSKLVPRLRSSQIFEDTFFPHETVVPQKGHQLYVAGAKCRDFGKTMLSVCAPTFPLSCPSSQLVAECLLPANALGGLGNFRQVQLFLRRLCSRPIILWVQLAHVLSDEQNGHSITLL